MTAGVAVEHVEIPFSPGALVDALARENGPVLLDSSALHGDFGRYSVLTCLPLEVLSLREGVLRDSDGDILAPRGQDAAIWSAPRPARRCAYKRGAVHVGAKIENACPGSCPCVLDSIRPSVGRPLEVPPLRSPPRLVAHASGCGTARGRAATRGHASVA